MKFQSIILVSLSIATIGTATILGAATPATARDVKAGPIWNNEDAQVKCPVAAAAVGGAWNGQWTTTIQGKESVCGVVHLKKSRRTEVNGRNVEAVRHSKGSFMDLGSGNWGEADLENTIQFQFQETNRDDWSVYLLDESRNVTIQLDLHRKKVVYGDRSNKFDLYTITSSKSRG
jgi:Mannan-binding protein